MKKLPIQPKHPERICWGCDKYCATSQMYCGNGSTRTMHPIEIFGEDWADMLSEEEKHRFGLTIKH
ncbi:DUF3079 domain-containing protein [Leeia sp. TBRC 13508]|uniref:DUF3079 domain-containing protein n=1 Tax=Leeia speluncae TaxID=2884804 RepID=A0ABS8D8M5_9NEIS|nr:DUF3079 domain-containing protein [Leeia speluncae]MCB6184482.1 DUF3079 domain-containing protein [Leeia speluncae]